LAKPSPVPEASGLYAWFFRQAPGVCPTEGCVTKDGLTLLYVGISPDKRSKPNSTQNLRKRIATHFRGNAEGSTLRRSLGTLLAEESGFPLRRVGSGKRITLTHPGEQWLDNWMQENAFVCWVASPKPWESERDVLENISCPLNIQGNSHNEFSRQLKTLRVQAIGEARRLDVAVETGKRARIL
jgi:hypothetical protein